MKRTISCAAAFALAFAQPYTAMCAEQIKEAQNPQSVIIAVNSSTTVTNGKITLEYENKNLKLEEVKFCSSLKNAMIEVNADNPGTIVIGFASSEPVEVKDCFAEMFFSGMTESESAFDFFKSMSVDELVTENEKGEDVRLPEDTLRLSGSLSESVISFTDSVSDEEGNISTYLQFDSILPFTNGTFSVKYDSSYMNFTGAETCGILKDAVYDINETEPGTIRFTFISGRVISSSGSGLKLNFSGKKSGSSDITVTGEEFSLITESGEIKKRDFTSEKGTLEIALPVKNADIVMKEGSEKCTVTAGISENTAVTNGVFVIRYNPSELKFESAKISDKLSGVMADFNETEPGVIRAVFISDKGIEAPGEILEFKFSELKSGEFEITSEAEELMMIDESGKTCEIIGKTGSCTIKCEAVPTVDTTVRFEGTEGVTNGNFTVTFDPEEFTFVDAESTDSESKIEIKAEETAPGKVKITFFSEEAVKTENHDFKITFAGKDETLPELSVTVDDVTLMAGTESVTNFKISFADEKVQSDCDVNGDGSVTTADYTELAMMILGKIKSSPSADISGDGKVDAEDLIALVKILKK